MKDYLPVSLNKISEIIKDFPTNEFTTADIICKYSGGFFSNVGTPASYSLNAQFGKLLQRNSNVLKITNIPPKVEIKDDIGRKTKSSVWQKNT